MYFSPAKDKRSYIQSKILVEYPRRLTKCRIQLDSLQIRRHLHPPRLLTDLTAQSILSPLISPTRLSTGLRRQQDGWLGWIGRQAEGAQSG